jgi:hypothetical protein
MRLLLIVITLFVVNPSIAQKGYLFIKKGVRKVKSIPEGASIKLQTTDGLREGYLTLVRKDSIFINGLPLKISEIRKVYLHGHHFFNKKEVWYTALGTIISALAIRLVSSKQDRDASAITTPMLGAGHLLYKGVGRKIKYGRAAYPIGRKFYLQVFDLRPL